jgi:Tfp pilus assembly protein PilF
MTAAAPRSAALRAAVLVLAAAVAPGQESRPESRSGSPTDLNGEALRLVEAGKLDDALALITRARALAPDDEVLATNWARIVTRSGQRRFEAGDLEGARADLDRALRAAPKEALTRVQLAIVLRSMGEGHQARREVERALADDPSCAAAFEELARIAYEDEDLTGAAEALATALKLDPSREPALKEFRDKVDRETRIESTWYRNERGRFVVKYDDQEFRHVGEVVLGFLDAAEEVARRTIGHVPARRVTVVLYSLQDFQSTTGAHAWAGGLFDGKIRLPVRNFRQTKDSIRTTIAHEYMHLVVRDLCRRCPTWLNEGLAQLAEGKSLPAAARTLAQQSEPQSFPAMPASWMGISDAKRVAEMYAQSLLFTDYLVRKFGYQAVRDVLVEANGTTGFDAAFAEGIGKTLLEAENDWRAAR